jgi:hypothetical protein
LLASYLFTDSYSVFEEIHLAQALGAIRIASFVGDGLLRQSICKLQYKIERTKGKPSENHCRGKYFYVDDTKIQNYI